VIGTWLRQRRGAFVRHQEAPRQRAESGWRHTSRNMPNANIDVASSEIVMCWLPGAGRLKQQLRLVRRPGEADGQQRRNHRAMRRTGTEE
jgi:hypothetical protein